jgi:hypothetical protein
VALVLVRGRCLRSCALGKAGWGTSEADLGAVSQAWITELVAYKDDR